MMKKLAAILLMTVLVALIAVWLAAQDRKYVGSSACKLCHKAELQGRQYVIWQDSLHAKSFAHLSTDKAAAIAKEAGIADPLSSPPCLGCHAPLADKAPELKAEGVTCETCHGPGSGYRKLNIMQDRAKAVQNGLVVYPDAAAIEAQCLKCHQNAHGVSFDFEKAWDKIKHPVPAK
jgi:hypothetical protein